MQAIPENNLKYPVLVTLNNSSGSGFFFGTTTKLYFVTAKHVLFDLNNMHLYDTHARLHAFSNSPGFSQPVEIDLDLDLLSRQNNIRTHTSKDVCTVEIGTVQSGNLNFNSGVTLNTLGASPLIHVDAGTVQRYADIQISNDVFLFGYPRSLGVGHNLQIEKDKPLLRKGIIAGKNDVLQTVIVDCPSYPGNSGGPVLQVEMHLPPAANSFTFRVFGVLTQFVPFEDRFQSQRYGFSNVYIQNSGYSVVEPIDCVFDIL